MKTRTPNNKGKTLFLRCIGAFLLVAYGAAPLVFPEAVQPLETCVQEPRRTSFMGTLLPGAARYAGIFAVHPVGRAL